MKQLHKSKKSFQNILPAFFFIFFGLFCIFAVAHAATVAPAAISCNPAQARTFKDLVMNLVVGCIISPALTIVIALGVLSFLWGVFKFMRAEGDDKQAGREFIVWGIVGIFVMVSLWGLVHVLQNTFVLNNNNITPRQVTIPGSNI